MKRMIAGLSSLLMVMALTATAQLISPQAGEAYSTPTNIVVSLPEGYLIKSVRVYGFSTNNAGTEVTTYLKQDVLNATTNVYILNPASATWYMPCGDYDVRVTYTTDGGSTYQLTTSGRIRIYTDVSSIRILHPTSHSVLVRGTPVTIKWTAIVKPGHEAMVVCLRSPYGFGCGDLSEFELSDHEFGSTNQIQWTVMTNTSFYDGRYLTPDDVYEIEVYPRNVEIPYTYGYAAASFQITSEPTVQPVLSNSVSGKTITLQVQADQAISRHWNIETSTNLVNWTIVPNVILVQGGTYQVPMNLSKQFFRTRMLE